MRDTGKAVSDALKGKAREGGLRFEAYLTPDLATWVLEMIERGEFDSPSEAVFALLRESKDLHEFPDLRKQLLRRILEAAIDDQRPSAPAEEAFARLRTRMERPLPEPAVWPKD